MLKRDDLPYFRLREKMEREAARKAPDPAGRDVHVRLAEHYADRIWALEMQERRRPTR